jgi:hypothetical protein
VAANPASSRTAFVTDNTPSAELTYHARFAFRANTLAISATGLNAATLFEGRSATGAQAFTLQYRGSGTTAQVRAVLIRPGLTAVTGAWVTIGNTAHLLQLDWAAATAGSLRLLIDGTVRYTLTGNNSTLRLESVLIGVTASAPAGATTGTAYFDSFLSTRNTLP